MNLFGGSTPKSIQGSSILSAHTGCNGSVGIKDNYVNAVDRADDPNEDLVVPFSLLIG